MPKESILYAIFRHFFVFIEWRGNMKNSELAEIILQKVGGPNNIKSFTNCVTRLRIILVDNDIVEQESLNKVDGVLGTQFQSGQFQVILGGKVVNVTEEFSRLLEGKELSDNEEKNTNVFSNILNTLSSILTPALPPVIAGGLLKGFIFLFQNLGWVSDKSSTLIFFNGLADAVFYFFPFLLAVSSAKKFKTNEYMALTVAGVLMYPFAFENVSSIKLFNFLPVVLVDYSSSVLPIIFSVWLLKYVKRFFDKKIPEMVNMVFSPILTMLIVIPISMSLLAPMGYYIGEYIAQGVKWLIDFSPWLAGLVVGATRPILVLGGMHHAMNPIMQQEVSSFGYSQMLAMVLMSTLAQATAPLIVYFRESDPKEKQIALSSVIPGYIGITEPAIYGVLVRYKGAMIASCVGGGIGAAICTMLGGRSFGFVMPGILSLPAFFGEGFGGIVIGGIVSVVITAILTLVLMNRFNGEENTEIIQNVTESKLLDENTTSIYSPVVGNIVSLNQIDDATFSQEILGKTIAISSKDGCVYAPMNTKIKVMFPTKHAIGLELENGVELLIHIGIDTVSLDGLGFNTDKKQGDWVQKGDVIMTFSKDLIKEKGLDDSVIVVVTNSQNYSEVSTSLDDGELTDINTVIFNLVK